MYYYLYKITNKINSKIYIGIHKTDNLSDGYSGSGKALKRARIKYGVDAFEKEILEYFPSEQEMVKREREIVNEDFVKSKDNYNLCIGGGTYSKSQDSEYHNSDEHLLNIHSARKLALEKAKSDKLKRMESYYERPKLCEFCNGPIEYHKKRTNKFCSSSCAASKNNTGRIVTEEHKIKTRKSMLKNKLD